MRPGRGKAKGSAFERDVCKLLSLWVSGGTQKDLFWRSAMSGGRATVARGAVRQAGDICAVAPEGHILTDSYYIECKTYRDLAFAAFFLKGEGILAKFWLKTIEEAERYGRHPLLIAKQNQLPALLLTRPQIAPVPLGGLECSIVKRGGVDCMVYQLDDVLTIPFGGKKTRVRI